MEQEHLYFIAYDILCPQRWRRVYKLMRGYGEWLQLSVFQCRLDRMRILELEAKLAEAINHAEDRVLIVDIGRALNVEPKIRRLGNMTIENIERHPTIV